MLNSEIEDILGKVEFLELIGFDDGKTFILAEYNSKKVIINIESNCGQVYLWFTPFVIGNFINIEEDEEDYDFEIVGNENEITSFNEYLKLNGAEKLTHENYIDYLKEKELLDNELGEYIIRQDDLEDLADYWGIN